MLSPRAAVDERRVAVLAEVLERVPQHAAAAGAPAIAIICRQFNQRVACFERRVQVALDLGEFKGFVKFVRAVVLVDPAGVELAMQFLFVKAVPNFPSCDDPPLARRELVAKLCRVTVPPVATRVAVVLGEAKPNLAYISKMFGFEGKSGFAKKEFSNSPRAKKSRQRAGEMQKNQGSLSASGLEGRPARAGLPER